MNCGCVIQYPVFHGLHGPYDPINLLVMTSKLVRDNQPDQSYDNRILTYPLSVYA